MNISGRVQNNYDKDDGTTVYGMAFTAEQVDYLDSKATSEVLRMRQDGAQVLQGERGQSRAGAEGQGAAADAAAPKTSTKPAAKGRARNRRAAHADAAMATDAVAVADQDIPF